MTQEDKEPIDYILYAAACGIKNASTMTQEDKQLLLKDLCARLPYFENWVQYEGKDYIVTGYGHGRVSLLPSLFSSSVGPCPLIEEVKPYLRPMSSMTEDEVNQYYKIRTGEDRNKPLGELDAELFDFYHKNHIDYRGLIPMGLAFEAKEGMYKTK